MTKRTLRYGVIRHGANASNQGMRETMLVAVIEASSRAKALQMMREEDVQCFSNQRLSLVPWSEVSAADAQEFAESQAAVMP